ncbi:MAG: glycerol-3-phosphate 1-O-acyltransferase PlsY [Acidobacteriia bacterium]|nr:glycerol-3-phosphate 1-O-acyltransferase PlsY [Terriglobia bacterium]
MGLAILAVPVAYLLGSIPFGYLIVKLKSGRDVREVGSRSIGATNVMRAAGRAGGILTFLLDVGKGFVAVLIAQKLSPENHWMIAAAAMSAILGHVFPLFLKFRGGKGVATGVGVFLAIFPQAVAAVLIIFVLIVWLSRYISLGSIVATSAFPVFAYFMGQGALPPPILIATALGALLIVAKHHENIRRLLRGTENKFTGFSKKTP